jgi:YfiR/HmsC-like
MAVALLIASSSSGPAQPAQPGEYQIKAAIIFNFAKFVEWPTAALPEANSPIIIGILGTNPFGDNLEKTMRNKTVEDHPLVIKQFHSAAEAVKSHVLFISNSEKDKLPDVLKALAGSSVLTVSEMDGFNEKGGMISFLMEGTKIRFKINNDTATKSGLKISSKLLSLASR